MMKVFFFVSLCIISAFGFGNFADHLKPSKLLQHGSIHGSPENHLNQPNKFHPKKRIGGVPTITFCNKTSTPLIVDRYD